MAFDEEHPFLHADLDPRPPQRRLTLGQKWRRKALSELVPLIWGENCCTSEWYAAVADIFGQPLVYPAETSAASQADLLIITGHVTEKAVPSLLAVVQAMPVPHFVIAAGACTQIGDEQTVTQKNLKNKTETKAEHKPDAKNEQAAFNLPAHGRALADIVPVDIVIPGCPPTPQAFAQGIALLKKMIKAGYRGQGIWQ